MLLQLPIELVCCTCKLQYHALHMGIAFSWQYCPCWQVNDLLSGIASKALVNVEHEGRVCSHMVDDSFLAIAVNSGTSWPIWQGKHGNSHCLLSVGPVSVACLKASWTQAHPELIQPGCKVQSAYACMHCDAGWTTKHSWMTISLVMHSGWFIHATQVLVCKCAHLRWWSGYADVCHGCPLCKPRPAAGIEHCKQAYAWTL